jgi:hypothetical protein
MPPFVFPLHPQAMFVRRPDLWCADEQGRPVPHLSLAFPEVRQRMVALLTEQAERYDIDGVHFFFCRGLPLVYFERPFMEAFRDAHAADPRGLPLDDARVWQTRATFFLQLLRDLRAALDQVGRRRGRRFGVAMHVMNSLRTCAYYGMDIEAVAREGLVDILLPARGHFFPDALGERHVTTDFLAEFARVARGRGIRVVPALEGRYWTDGASAARRAAMYYAAGADGVVASSGGGVRSEFAMHRRLGHIDELDSLDAEVAKTHRRVAVHSLAGMPFDMNTGLPTCG